MASCFNPTYCSDDSGWPLAPSPLSHGSHLNPLCSMVTKMWLLLETDSVGVLECVFVSFSQNARSLGIFHVSSLIASLENLRPSPKQVTQPHLPLFSLSSLSLSPHSFSSFLLITYYLSSKQLNMNKRICCKKLGMLV